MTAASFRESGWVWEGFATHAGVKPTLYGVGEGWRWFGVPGVNFMFHPNNEIAFQKLADSSRAGEAGASPYAPKVVADISKWDFEYSRNEGGYEMGFIGVHDPRPERIREEAANLSRMAAQFPNITGGIVDDASNMFALDGYGPTGAASIRQALRQDRDDLDLWVVVYANQMDKPEWELLKPHMDIVNLWLWDCREIPNLPEHFANCRRLFPDQRIIIGSYLHDFTSRQNMPLDLLELQYETMLRLWEAGEIEGFNILGAFYIDQAPEQAEWVRDFLARH